jgi:hypothetical protein
VNHAATTSSEPRELAYRANDGIEVWLLWTKSENRVFVLVYDVVRNTSFELDVEPAHALEVFHHPLAYAAFRGIDHELETVRRDTLVPGA